MTTRPTASNLRATDRAAWREAVLAAHVGASSVPDVAARLGISVPRLAVWRRELKIRGPLRPRVAPAPTHRIELRRTEGVEVREIRARSDQQAVNIAGRACDHEGADEVTVTRLSDGAMRTRRSWSTWPRAGWSPPGPIVRRAKADAEPVRDPDAELASAALWTPVESPRASAACESMVASFDGAAGRAEGILAAVCALDAHDLTPSERSAAARAFLAFLGASSHPCDDGTL